MKMYPSKKSPIKIKFGSPSPKKKTIEEICKYYLIIIRFILEK